MSKKRQPKLGCLFFVWLFFASKRASAYYKDKTNSRRLDDEKDFE